MIVVFDSKRQDEGIIPFHSGVEEEENSEPAPKGISPICTLKPHSAHHDPSIGTSSKEAKGQEAAVSIRQRFFPGP